MNKEFLELITIFLGRIHPNLSNLSKYLLPTSWRLSFGKMDGESHLLSKNVYI